eukprot:gene10026-7003_t
MSFILKAMGFGDSIPNFPFKLDPDDQAPQYEFVNGIRWTLQTAVSRESSPSSTHPQLSAPTYTSAGEVELPTVSVFHTSLKSLGTEEMSMARNALKRIRTLRIQGLLTCLAAVEHHDRIYIATERCVSLRDYLERQSRVDCGGATTGPAPSTEERLTEDEVALGIRSVCRGLHSVHLNGLLHGNVGMNTVFVTKHGGFWKLFGFELITPVGSGVDMNLPYDDPKSSRCFCHGLRMTLSTNPGAVPPEVMSCVQIPRSVSHLLQNPTSSLGIDAWGLAGLIHDVAPYLSHSGPAVGSSFGPLRVENAKEAARRLPAGLRQGFAGLLSANPSSRPSMQNFVDHTSFITDSAYVRCIENVETYEVHDTDEKESLVGTLERHFATSAFPLAGCLWMMDRITSQLHMSTPRNIAMPMFHLIHCIPPSCSFTRVMLPILTRLYLCRDRFVRMQLLQGIPLYSERLASEPVRVFVWPQVLEGFRSTSPEILALTARGAVLLAQHMSPTSVIELIQALAPLQQHPDPSLRANATLCVAAVADRVSLESRVLVLGNAYARVLKDPEPRVRLAAAIGFRGFCKWMTPQQLATILLPHMVLLTVDKHGPVREIGFEVVQYGLSKLREVHQQAPMEEPSCDPNGTPIPEIEFWVFDHATALKEAQKLLFGDNFSSNVRASQQRPHGVPDAAAPKSVGLGGRRLGPAAAAGSGVPTGSKTARPAAVEVQGSGWSDDDEDKGDDDWGSTPLSGTDSQNKKPPAATSKLGASRPSRAISARKAVGEDGGSGWSDDDGDDWTKKETVGGPSRYTPTPQSSAGRPGPSSSTPSPQGGRSSGPGSPLSQSVTGALVRPHSLAGAAEGSGGMKLIKKKQVVSIAELLREGEETKPLSRGTYPSKIHPHQYILDNSLETYGAIFVAPGRYNPNSSLPIVDLNLSLSLSNSNCFVFMYLLSPFHTQRPEKVHFKHSKSTSCSSSNQKSLKRTKNRAEDTSSIKFDVQQYIFTTGAGTMPPKSSTLPAATKAMPLVTGPGVMQPVPLLLLPPTTTRLFSLVSTAGSAASTAALLSNGTFSLTTLHALLRGEASNLVRRTRDILRGDSGAVASPTSVEEGNANSPFKSRRSGGTAAAGNEDAVPPIPSNAFLMRAMQHLQNLLRDRAHLHADDGGHDGPATLCLLQFLTWTCLEGAALAMEEDNDRTNGSDPRARGRGGGGSGASGSGADSTGTRSAAGLLTGRRLQRSAGMGRGVNSRGGRNPFHRAGAQSTSVCATPAPGLATGGGNNNRFSGTLSEWRAGACPKDETMEEGPVTDAQCAELLFTVLLSDVLVALAKATATASDATAPGTAPPAPSFVSSIHFYALSLLGAALMRYEPVANGTFLSRLFPAEESVAPSGSSSTVSSTSASSGGSSSSQEALTILPSHTPRHPILYPLFYSHRAEVRWAAAFALHNALQYLSCFNIAEEPHKRRAGKASARPALLSFVPISVQSGQLVVQLHDCLLWALRRAGIAAAGAVHSRKATGDAGKDDAVATVVTQPTAATMLLTPTRATALGACGYPVAEEVEVAVLTDKTRSLVMQLLSTLTAVTPYSRCPTAVERVKAVLQLPYLRLVLRGRALFNLCTPMIQSPLPGAGPSSWGGTPNRNRATPGGSEMVPSVTPATAELRAVISLFTHCIRRLGTQLNLGPYFTEEVQRHKKKEPETGSPQKRMKATPAAEDPDEILFQFQLRALPTSNSSLLDALLANAPTFSPVWRCVTQLARFYPELIGDPDRLEKLLRASEISVQVCFPQAAARSRASLPETQAESAIVAPMAADEEAYLGLAELLRSWTHFMGYVWRPFDGKAEDPALSPQVRHYQPIDGNHRQCSSSATSSSTDSSGKNGAFAEQRSFVKALLQLATSDGLAKCAAVATASDAPTQRASLAQKSLIFQRVLYPVIAALLPALLKAEKERRHRFAAVHKDPNSGPGDKAKLSSPSHDSGAAPHAEVVLAALRCAAQISTECVEAIMKASEASNAEEADSGATSAEKTSSSTGGPVGQMVELALICARDSRAAVRVEALTTVGVWLWSYPSLDAHAGALLHCALDRLYMDDDAECRTKAALALSNASARLPEEVEKAGASKEFAAATAPNTFRGNPEVISLLCEAAAYAAVEERGTPAVQHHGVRMMRMLLSVMTVEECIAPLEELPDEVVAEAFVRLLNEFVSSGRDPKLRWNAAIALGGAISREEVFEAEPAYASKAIKILCDTLRRDAMFKVRTRAAEALGTACLKGMRGEYSDNGDYTPEVMESLCVALTSTSSARRGAEDDRGTNTSHCSANTTTGPASAAHLIQGKEELRRALLHSIESLLRTANPSAELNKVIAKHTSLLQDAGIL